MSIAACQVRRATVDDLASLIALWEAMHFSALDLEKRLTEFQVAISDEGRLLGALAIEINGRYGRLHSEAFVDFGLANALREALWERMQSVATNHGLVRLWTNETAPFWKTNGFQPAASEALGKLPPPWNLFECQWLTLQLRDEEALQIALEKEFLRFRDEEQLHTGEALRKARTVNFIASGFVLILAAAIVIFSIYLLMRNQRFMGH